LLWYGDCAHRWSKVSPRGHPLPDPVEVSCKILLKHLQDLTVNPGCAMVGFDRFVSFIHLTFLDSKRLVCRIYRSHPVSSCSKQYDHLIRPLCSDPITGPSTLVRVGPSQFPASVLSPRGLLRLGFSLRIRALVPAVPRECLCP